MNFRAWLLQTVLIVPAILIAFTVHSFAQAAIADRLGDKNPRAMGRLTLNPLAHVDLMGFLMILLFQFGWGKPVETNPSAYKHYYKDDLKVRLSGIISNLGTAILFAIIYAVLAITNVIPAWTIAMQKPPSGINIGVPLLVELVINYTIGINCMFAIINIIPIPGLDGFYIMRDVSPKFFYRVADKMYRSQFIILIIFIFFAGPILVGIPSNALASLLLHIGKSLV